MLSFPRLSLLSLATSSFFLTVQASGHARDTNSGIFTWFVDGLGACGITNTATDNIVALNIPQWDSGSHCFQTITLSYGGKTAQAQITDQCGNCASGSLDLSHGLFQDLIGDPEEIGTVSGSWSFAGSSTTTTSSSTSQYTPPSTTQAPTSTSTPPPSTTSSTTPTSTSTSQSTFSTTSSSSSSTSTTG
ncbi:hypothetical protein BT96DRAFT_248689 [Gymnopus androsaceus JB14]|uniref:RlpA-like protein double-psi beta-barrel domain-containing protein n=1 Tax=Gymnopus androsaceus JB14 TaxID=1447944 RepID=A0A6A4IFK2_9AGAR|nr:hypothetical protein BT96DRAFT_248689 [Gymnopus androsaceus JB14]